MGETVSAKAYVTGAVVAVYGREGSDGEFLVQHILEPGLPPQEPLLSHRTSGEDKYVALVSDGEFVLARLILSTDGLIDPE
ncbi:hypothetical protein GOP47_0026438 [Adiantum capillus-veneris]|nr:hypothetical protein GOP47_0026438 [Adiantum capillus-veneris]